MGSGIALSGRGLGRKTLPKMSRISGVMDKISDPGWVVILISVGIFLWVALS